MAYTAWDTDTSTGDDPATFAATTKANVEAVDLHHIGTSAPSTGLANGRVWFDNTTASKILRKYYQNSAWVTDWATSATAHIAVQNVDFDGNEALNILAEKVATGSLVTTEAQIQFDTTLKYLAWGDGTDTMYAKGFKSDASSYVRIPCALNVSSQGTPATASTATDLGGWQMDASGERLNVVAMKPIPAGWTGANDLVLEVECLLLNAETASDTIDLDMTWRSLSDADGPTKTGTEITAVSHDISTGNAQYDRHLVSMTVDFDDATNPVAVDDLFMAEIFHDPAAGGAPVAGIIVVGAYLKVPAFGPEDE